ncbi:atlastin-2 [Octopus bimaculoides]|uniref:GB1/RHD3-type G domain-containing protein n=1 Tax=Octopus bimaculoides TaxID=37653 RepID=A0A0L8HBN7_OCTBM|nr:atlastin-2 [Octopus bimaculoides]XP_014773655.1 atlastin-2 [Octopus bimaculoides]XP_014773656.1 atlastin-2 [Octopus bimaculoides]XP_052829476.1 atlastin-2 [Octopus bimaculoides]XP_052829485.1 atlastin-2 [Octopus bimaculoides]XP_052829491.1 atlastin-2 [Octopus bimaculoides]|eukprot:XP_014773653.1 PREDICTED: atlastin-2-like [Octopus bimaculoides]
MVKGHPVQIVLADEDHSFTLDEEALKSVLLQPEIRDKKVVVISVAGAFRKGKSFLLDFFLRYEQHTGPTDWLSDEEQQLEGFSWRGGSERDTTGILLWSEPFIISTSSGVVAVIFMDTQGAFDSLSTVRDCATVFALSTMISSVQVYNISQNIQENDLQHLQLFTEYGRLALDANDNESKPFQALTFLVRDWSCSYEHSYGMVGGNEILEKRFAITDRQHSELQQLRRHIRSCFQSINCFLMPHPGLKVASDPKFTGKLKDIEPDFRQYLRSLVNHILAPEKLVVKEINGTKITCGELVEYFKAYINIYQGEELPEPKSMLEATAEANNLAAVACARNYYSTNMEAAVGGNRPYLHPDCLNKDHAKFQEEALKLFRSTRKMGGSEFSHSYEEKLQKEIEELFVNFCNHNESKNIFKTARTPAVLVIMMIFFYFGATLFAFFGLSPVAALFNLIMWIVLLLIIVAGYVRYSGEYIDIGSAIDQLAEKIWENVISHVLAKAGEQTAKYAVKNQMKNKKV